MGTTTAHAHHRTCGTSTDNVGSRRSAAEAMSFWYMTTCHELAHNSFELHNEQHGALLEWIAHAYMPVLHKHLPPATTTRKG